MVVARAMLGRSVSVVWESESSSGELGADCVYFGIGCERWVLVTGIIEVVAMMR